MSEKETNATVSGEFTVEKETKRTMKFEETVETHIMGTAYVQKRALEVLGNPNKIRITIEAA